MKPSALLIHVPDVVAGLAWYQQAFPEATKIYLPEYDFTVLDLQGFYLEIVQADNKVGSGHGSGNKGTVLYWSVPAFETAVQHFIVLGAQLYRGPMAIEAGMVMCQLEDPFGNLLGLRGPSIQEGS